MIFKLPNPRQMLTKPGREENPSGTTLVASFVTLGLVGLGGYSLYRFFDRFEEPSTPSDHPLPSPNGPRPKPLAPSIHVVSLRVNTALSPLSTKLKPMFLPSDDQDVTVINSKSGQSVTVIAKDIPVDIVVLPLGTISSIDDIVLSNSAKLLPAPGDGTLMFRVSASSDVQAIQFLAGYNQGLSSDVLHIFVRQA